MDILPIELITELSKLQDNITPFPTEDAVHIIEQEIGKSLKEIFTEFSRESDGSASISQVHIATLQNGERVAVKIQRPHIEEINNTDLEIMNHLAGLMGQIIEGMDTINPVRIAEEFELVIRRELNFIIEKTNMLRFREVFRKIPEIYVSKVYKDLATRRVLTMEYVEWQRLGDIYETAVSITQKIIAQRFADLLLMQVFNFGFFHADIHPDNIFIIPDYSICMPDFGMVGFVSTNFRYLLNQAIIAVSNRDYHALTYTILKITANTDIETIDVLE